MTEAEAIAKAKMMAKKLAHSLNMLEGMIIEGKSMCNLFHWNDEVFYQIEEAAQSLGFAMATLLNWDETDPIEQEYPPVPGLYQSSTVVYDTPEEEK